MAKTPNAGSIGLNPGEGTNIMHAAWCGQKNKERKNNLMVARKGERGEGMKKKGEKD